MSERSYCYMADLDFPLRRTATLRAVMRYDKAMPNAELELEELLHKLMQEGVSSKALTQKTTLQQLADWFLGKLDEYKTSVWYTVAREGRHEVTVLVEGGGGDDDDDDD